MMHIRYLDTSVFDAPLFSSPLSFPSPPNSQAHASSWHDPQNPAVVDEFLSLVFAIPLPYLYIIQADAKLQSSFLHNSFDSTVLLSYLATETSVSVYT